MEGNMVKYININLYGFWYFGILFCLGNFIVLVVERYICYLFSLI